MVRYGSCYCINCITDDEGHCLNKEWVDDWKEIDIPREGSTATTRQTAEDTIDLVTAVHIADLAASGSTVAIASQEDPVYMSGLSDFYLSKVTSKGVEELAQPTTNDYLIHYPTGSDVFKGHFFLRKNIHDMTYTLDTSRVAIVYAATVRHILSDLAVQKTQKKAIYKLSLTQHEEIISSM